MLSGRGLYQFLSLNSEVQARCASALKYPRDALQMMADECAPYPPVREQLRYVAEERCSEIETPLGRRDPGRDGKTLQDFVEHPMARAAELSEAHVVALRLYSTQAAPPP